MEDPKTSAPIENMLRKKCSIIFRGTMQGIIGGVTVGLVFGLIYVSFDTFSSLSFFPPSTHLKYLINVFVALMFDAVVLLGLPVGVVIGLSTGILAVSFGHHCPKLSVWLVLSCFGAITGFELGVFLFYGWTAYSILLGITLTSLAAGGMAYQATIPNIQRGVPKKGSQVYTVLCSSSYVFLTFVMLCPYFFLSNMST